MANRLKMAEHQAILGLARLNWSYRRIAAELGVDRETVSRHVKAELNDPQGIGPPLGAGSGQAEPNATISITGSAAPEPVIGSSPAGAIGHGANPFDPAPGGPKAAIVITGSEASESGANATARLSSPKSIPITGVAGSTPSTSSGQASSPQAGRRSGCEPWRQIIIQGLEQGLTARQIWQDLVSDHGFAGSYQSVQRLVRKLGAATPLPFRRMECQGGEEAQIDFGKGAAIITSDGKRKRPHLFRIVLSCSRKAYSEVVMRQTTDEFLRCIENAFWYFGGVPKTLVIDNLKAAGRAISKSCGRPRQVKRRFVLRRRTQCRRSGPATSRCRSVFSNATGPCMQV